MRAVVLLLSLLACTGAKNGAPPPAPVDVRGVSSAELHGTPPPEAKAAPEFTVSNDAGESRDRTALIGQPTVMWFYPAAATYG